MIEASTIEQAESCNDNVAFAQQNNNLRRLVNVQDETREHNKYTSFSTSELNRLYIVKWNNTKVKEEGSSVLDSENLRTTTLRKMELPLASNKAYEDPKNAQEPISASFSSSTSVDIELTLGGPYLRSSCANCKR
ncbi:hypothetical protein Tco_0023196 [Tanacetum coccineum]